MKKIKIDVYEQEILAFDSYKSFLSFCKKNKYVMHEDESVLMNSIGCVGVVERGDGSGLGDIFMIVESKDISVITHEAVHAAIFILSGVGVSFNLEEQEPLAYLTGFIFKSFCKAFKVLPFDQLKHETNSTE
jgi:hypothetical protein